MAYTEVLMSSDLPEILLEILIWTEPDFVTKTLPVTVKAEEANTRGDLASVDIM